MSETIQHQLHQPTHTILYTNSMSRNIQQVSLYIGTNFEGIVAC